jgi:hypothetical protein
MGQSDPTFRHPGSYGCAPVFSSLHQNRIELTAVADDCFAEKSDGARRGTNAPAMVTESVVIFFDWKIRIGLKTLRFNEMGPTRGMDVKQMNHRGRKGKIQRDVITNLDKHFVGSSKFLLKPTGCSGSPDTKT